MATTTPEHIDHEIQKRLDLALRSFVLSQLSGHQSRIAYIGVETTTTECIDKGARKYLGLVPDLLSRKNALLPIFRLPPETLENIFTHAARDYYEGTDHSSFRVPDWVNVSYVCCHWRNVALNCPTLWAYHFTVSSRWTEELLVRSKNASLKIRINHEYHRATSWWSRLVEQVLNHAERIEELRLSIPSDILPTEFSLNAPRLQILDLQNRSFQQMFKIDNGNALALRTLKLTEFPLPWHSSFNLSGITTLSLHIVPSPSQQDVLEFLTTLSCMQRLAVLHLEYALPSACDLLSSRAFTASPKITLPSLARLFVHAPLFTVVGLLSCVDIPPKTQLRLEIEGENNSSIDFDQLLAVLGQRFSRSEDLSSSIPTIRSLIICFTYNSRFTLTALESGDCDPYLSYPPHDCNIPLRINVTMEETMAIRHASCIVGNICCSIPLTHVQTLHVINPPFAFSDDFWKKTLGRLDGLRYLKLSHGCMPTLACSLLSFTDGSVEAPRHMFVPGLEELELYCITFSSGDVDDWSEEFISGQQALVDALSTRKMLQLTMTECDVKAMKEDEEEEGSDCECDLCLIFPGRYVH